MIKAKMKFVIFIIIGTVFLLVSCGTISKPREAELKCKLNSKGEWECTIEAVWQKPSGKYNNLSMLMYYDFAIDFSRGSNELLEQQLNIGRITLKSNGVPIATKLTSYQKNGATISATNSIELINWLSAYDNQIDEISITIDKIKFNAHTGVNTIVAEFTQNGNVFAGASTSEYVYSLPKTADFVHTY